jgi:hypothetical protein
LEEIGFDWDERYDDKWQQMYEDLKAYKEQVSISTSAYYF